jgi:hypothetical protein
MRLTAGGAPVAVKRRAVDPVSKVKILNIFSNLKSHVRFEVPSAVIMRSPFFSDSSIKQSMKPA